MNEARPSPPGLPGSPVLGLVGIGLLAFACRAVGYEQVFLDDGSVVYALGDAFYHARLGLWAYHHFPSFLSYDLCLNAPDGASVPYGPLWDLVMAGAARAVGGDFDRVAPWLVAAVGALTVWPTYALARRLGGVALGLGAALLYAFLPVAIVHAQVGNIDHHAPTALLGALLLVLLAAVIDPETERGRRRGLFVAVGLVQAALALTWQGSLLYLGAAQVALFVAAAQAGDREIWLGQAASAALGATLLLPFVALSAEPLAGAYSSTELSRLHPLFLWVCAAVAIGSVWLEARRPAGVGLRSGFALRLVRGAGLGLAIAAILLLATDLAAGIAPALAFLAKEDDIGAALHEQLPLFVDQGRLSRDAGERRVGYLAYLLILAPLLLAQRSERPERRATSLLLLGWTLLFGVLAYRQYRYANDFAPLLCALGAFVVARGAQALAERVPVPARLAALLLGALVLAPTVWKFHLPHSSFLRAHWRGDLEGVDRALLSVAGSQVRFAQSVGKLLPPGGCRAANEPAEHVVLTHPGIGHVLHYAADQATPTDNFGPYVGLERYRSVRRALSAESEAEFLVEAEALGARWVATLEEGGEPPPGTLGVRLQRQDGRATETQPHWGRLRLVTEGPRGGLPISVYFEGRVRPGIPYKLFEVVPGALLEVAAPPGAEVVAKLPLETPAGRRFPWRAAGQAGDDGWARLRVPYASASASASASANATEGPVDRTRARGPYRIAVAGRPDDPIELRVGEEAIQLGRTLRVPGPAPSQDH